jgi:Na+-translocating ferredoxin:NAD+ oxidoreductase RnfC subunit
MKRSEAVRLLEDQQATRIEDEVDIGEDDWGQHESQEDFANMSNEDLARRLHVEGIGGLDLDEEVEEDDAEPEAEVL